MTEPKQGSVPISEGREQDRLEMRLDLLGRLLGSFESLDLEEASRRIVDQTFEALQADRAWLLWMPQPDARWATVVYERNDPEYPGAFTKGERIPLDPSRNLLARLRAATEPVAVYRGDPDLDPAIAERYQIRAQLLQLLRMPGSGAWVFGLHRCRSDRRWTQFEVDLFAEVGRLAAIAIHNAEIHRKATADAARLRATLEQIPIPAMIVNRQGEIEMVNPEAFRQGLDLAADLAERIETNAPRTIDGRALTVEELPGMRALRGEQVCEELILRDRQGEERTVEIRAAPIQDQDAEILGAVILLSDVTRERKAGWREKLRRRRAEAIAALGLDLLAESLNLNDLDGIAELIGKAISANVFLYFYRRDQDRLVLTGGYSESARWPAFRQYLTEHPFRVDEGLPGTAFSLRRPLLFSELKSNAIADFSRDETERELKESLDERSLIAYPIESKDEPIGVITLSLSGAGRVIDSDDLDFAHDIAERIGAANRIQELTRTTAESLRASEELARRETNARARLEAVLESAPVGIAVVSADELRFELVNARWIQLVEKVGRVADSSDLIDRQVGDEFPALDEQLKEVAESGTSLVDEETEMMIGGERRYFNRIVSPVRGRFSGSTQSLTVLLQDVTDRVLDRREIEVLAQVMEERSARLDSILSSMTDALWVYDASAQLVDVNQAALLMFGIGSRREALAFGAVDGLALRHADGRPIPRPDHPLMRALQGERIPDFVAVGRHPITSRSMDLSIAAAPIRSGGEVVGAVVVMRDITALLELDRKKDEFLSVASHELRTPLTTIKGYSQLLRHGATTLSPKEQHEFLDSVLSEIDRMMGLISELLDVSRIETKRLELQRESIGWIAFLRARVATFQMQVPDRPITLRTAIEERHLKVDPQRMRQVIDNLLSNALKYSDDDAAVEIVVEERPGTIATSVVDHGIGIPEKELPKLFERFHRASNVSSRYYGGLGLGLYISKAIVEAHGGVLSVRSEEMAGSTFTFALPES